MAETTVEATKVSSTQQELTELLAYVKQQTVAGVEGSKALVSQQAPLVAKEIVANEIAMSALWLCGALVLGGLVLWGEIALYRIYKKNLDETYEPMVWLGLVGGLITLAFAIPNLASLVHALVAPRLVILDYLKHLL
jgi:hypothetical protein